MTEEFEPGTLVRVKGRTTFDGQPLYALVLQRLGEDERSNGNEHNIFEYHSKEILDISFPQSFGMKYKGEYRIAEYESYSTVKFKEADDFHCSNIVSGSDIERIPESDRDDIEMGIGLKRISLLRLEMNIPAKNIKF